MIEYDSSSYIKLLFRFQGGIFDSVWQHVLLSVAIAVGVCIFHSEVRKIDLPQKPHELLIIGIGLLLVFRTQLSYSRYWEGRSILGTMIFQCRDLARQVGDFVDDDTEEKLKAKQNFVSCPEDFKFDKTTTTMVVISQVRYLKTFFAATRMHLRDEDDVSLFPFLTEGERSRIKGTKRKPLTLVSWCSKEIAALRKAEAMGELRLKLIDTQLSGIIQSFNGVDKIKSTPVPFPYSQMLAVFLCAYCFSVPLMLVSLTEWYTPIPTALITLALFGINAIGLEIEDPFGYDANDLDVTKMNGAVDADVNMFMNISNDVPAQQPSHVAFEISK